MFEENSKPPEGLGSFLCGLIGHLMAGEDATRAALAAIPQAREVTRDIPDGWRLVPVEANGWMRSVGVETWHDERTMAATWSAMLDAAPAPPAAPQSNQDDGWRPIETAPKDGSSVLLGGEDGSYIVAFYNRSGTWDDGDFNDSLQGYTYWRPLPAPPETAGGASDRGEGA